MKHPMKGGNTVLCRVVDRIAPALTSTGPGSERAVDLQGVGLIVHALDVKTGLLFSFHPQNLILSHLSDPLVNSRRERQIPNAEPTCEKVYQPVANERQYPHHGGPRAHHCRIGHYYENAHAV